MEPAEACRRARDGAEVDVIVSPRASRSGFDGFDSWRGRFVVRVRAPPLGGRANREVEELFEEVTGFRAAVSSGQASRQKTVAVAGDRDAVWGELKKTL